MALIGLILFVIGIWQAVFDDLLAGGFLMLVGLGVFLWAGGLFSRFGNADEEELPPEPILDTGATEAVEITETPVEPEPDGERFTVYETGDDTYLDAVAELLAKNPEIETMVGESGRHYSVPDGDDLPEWFALRVYCARGARPLDDIMNDLNAEIREKLGEEAFFRLSVMRY